MDQQPYILSLENHHFPDPNLALEEPNGLLAMGGDLAPERLLEAYKNGIFPWYEADQPLLWWSPDPRAVLFFDQFKISRSLQKTLNKKSYEVSYDKDFPAVIKACAKPRDQSAGTWITEEMVTAYCQLHQLGHAHSVEIWQDKHLVGGLYGISIKQVFCGESMFSLKPDASKVALYYLIQKLKQKNYKFIDCQLMNPHLKSLGATTIPRKKFLDLLNAI